MRSRETLARFDVFLADRDLIFEAVVIGGAALALLGVVTRQTRDCDILHPQLSEAIRAAATELAALVRREGGELSPDWLNNGPLSLADALPPGWKYRIQLAFPGRALTLRSLGRLDLLRSKLLALCDRGLDLADCIALAPTSAELDEVLPWLELQDANPGWSTHVRDTFDDLWHRLGHGV